MVFRILVLVLLIPYQSNADGRIVRGGGGIAEMLAHYALVSLPHFVSTCERSPQSCQQLSKDEFTILEALKVSLAPSHSPLFLNHISQCQQSSPHFDSKTREFTVESCLLYTSEMTPHSYEHIFSLVFINVCLSLPYSSSLCSQILQRLTTDMSVSETSFVLYQELKPVRLSLLAVDTLQEFNFHVFLEYFDASYDITSDLTAKLQCQKLKTFEIGAVSTNVTADKTQLKSDVMIRWECALPHRSYSAHLLMELPIEESELQGKAPKFQLIGRKKY